MSNARIFIVEDDALVATDMEECLEHLGYEVCGLSSTGEEAAVEIDKCRPDLVLMDIILDGKWDGVQTATEVRKLNIPVVFVTAHADESTLKRVSVTQPYGYVIKPFEELEVRAAIELALTRHASEAEQVANPAPERNESDFRVNAQHLGEERSEDTEELAVALRKIELFSHIPESILRKVASVSRKQYFKVGEYLAYEEDDEVWGFAVLEGRVSLVKTSISGRDLIVELLPPGDPFGLLLANQNGPYPVSARAQKNSTVMWVPPNAIQAILEFYPEIGQKFIDQVFMRLRNSHNVSRALAHDFVEVRIAYALLALIPKFSNDGKAEKTIDIEMTRQELAELTGSTAETIVRACKGLEKKGALDLGKSGIISISNLQPLRELAEEYF